MTPFAPTPADLARIDRARAEAWLTAHGWEASEVHGTKVWDGPRDGWVQIPHVGARDSARRWLEVLAEVARAHDLRGLALWSVLVSWQTPPPVDE